MTDQQNVERAVHPAARIYAEEVRNGTLSRREFLTRTTALGVASATAYGLIGLEAPVSAQEAMTPVEGGTVRMNMELRPLKDPRTWDWSEIANFARGWLDYMVEYEPDGSIRPMLLESWEASSDAKVWTLKVRQGVKWNNGDDFTAEDVVHNIRRWCDGTVEGNSMASRLGGLIDPATKQMREDAVVILDPATVLLTLSEPDVGVIANLTDYPAAVVHQSYDNGDFTNAAIGTGPYRPETNEVGVRQVLVRNPDHVWWGTAVHGGPYLDRIEYIDYGTDPAAVLAAAESGEIDATYQTTGDFIDIYDSLGWVKSEAMTAATPTIRVNQSVAPYDNVDVRRAIQLAVNNSVVLELGYSNRGEVAQNHHVSPLHPEYAEVKSPEADPAAAKALLDSTGFVDHEFELISVDDSWQASTCDAVAAQLRDAGFNVKRTVLPGATFWPGWMDHPFSATEWNMRPLAVQIYNLGYKSGGAWNETDFSNPEFDSLLVQANGLVDAAARRDVMAKLEQMMLDQGVVITPYWRALYRHTTPRVHGAEKHPTLEHHHYKWWIEPEN